MLNSGHFVVEVFWCIFASVSPCRSVPEPCSCGLKAQNGAVNQPLSGSVWGVPPKRLGPFMVQTHNCPGWSPCFSDGSAVQVFLDVSGFLEETASLTLCWFLPNCGEPSWLQVKRLSDTIYNIFLFKVSFRLNLLVNWVWSGLKAFH